MEYLDIWYNNKKNIYKFQKQRSENRAINIVTITLKNE